MEKVIDLKPMSEIKNKLIGAFIFTTFIISILYGLLVFNAMKYTEDDILNQRLELEAANFIQHYERDPSSAILPSSIGLSSYLSRSTELPQWLKAQPLGTRELHDTEVHIGIFEVPHSNQLLYIVLSELETSNFENETSSLILILIGVGAFITFLGLLIGLIFSNQISKPIILLNEDVKKNHIENRADFYGNNRNDEVGALSRSFRELVLRLQAFVTREKQFTQYVSHELRTPISLIKNAMAVLNLPEQSEDRRERNLIRIESAAIEMESLIDTFLSLGRESSKKNQETIKLAELLRSNLKRNELVNKSKKLTIQLDIQNETTINNDKKILTILIDNIIRNIFAHGKSTATITLLEKSILFENNIGEPTAKNSVLKESKGMEIINQLAEKTNITITTAITEHSYFLKIEF